MRADVQQIMQELGIVDMCLGYIKSYPDELIDYDVLSYCLDLVSAVI